MSERWCLVRDDSGHWYLCLHEDKSAAEYIFERIEAGEDLDEPDFVKRINGPHNLTFINPEEE